MGHKQNYIEINGKRYDAVTGAILPSSPSAAHNSTPTHAAPVQKAVKPVVDGFVRRPKPHQAVPVQRGGKALPIAVTQHSKTLMRAAVKKPQKLATTVKTQDAKHAAAQQVEAKPKSPAIVLKPRVAAVAPERAQHAAEVKKSSLIKKFGMASTPAAESHSVTVAPLKVRPAPLQAPAVAHVTARPVAANKTADLLDKALQAAQGHTEQYHEPKRTLSKRVAKKLGVSGKAITITTAVLAGLLLGGFYAYQNVPNLAMRVAAARAGFAAGMPSYSPSGFSFKGPVQYSSGQVVVSFKSNTDDRSFKITQQSSNWTSDSLLNNFVAVSGREYQTYQDRGRTVYIYNGSNATWVNGGVWYQIEGKSDLTSDQLVRIASSL